MAALVTLIWCQPCYVFSSTLIVYYFIKDDYNKHLTLYTKILN